MKITEKHIAAADIKRLVGGAVGCKLNVRRPTSERPVYQRIDIVNKYSF